MLTNTIKQAFSRLSTREKVLVSAMLAVLALAIVFLAYFALQKKTDNLRANLQDQQEMLLDLYDMAPSFKVNQARFQNTRSKAIQNRDLNLTTAIANIAGNISFEAIDARRGPLGTKELKDYIEFKSTKEKQVTKASQRASSRRANEASYFQREQEITLKENVPFKTIYQLLDRIEKSDDMLFVTDLRLDKSRIDPERAGHAKIVVSAFFWQESTTN